MDSIKLPRSDAGLKLVQFCRDEAHRFAISFHRKRRGKSALET
ncbi:UvrABC system protein C [uncultured archaeon]|nr:UvrABC system protein C [uncultured archaeon]